MFRVWLRYLECLVFGHVPPIGELVDLGTHLVQITKCPHCGRKATP